MKEILYIQTGPRSNFTGTHFWNTQDSYFTDGPESESEQHDGETSFREGQSSNVCVLFSMIVFLRGINWFRSLGTTHVFPEGFDFRS